MPTVSARFLSPRRVESHLIIRVIRWVRTLTHVAQGLLMVGLLFPRIGHTARRRLIRSWSAKLLRILNISLSVRGKDPLTLPPNLVAVANHTSWLDIFVIDAIVPLRFIAKSEIRQWPVVGWLCYQAGTIFIHRGRRRDTARINHMIHDALAAGDRIGFFPEGTTTDGQRLLKFHTSLFEPAVVNDAHVAPIAIRYLTGDGRPCPAPIYIGEMTFAASLGQVIRQPAMIAELIFVETIAAGVLSRRELALQAEQAIASALNVPSPHPNDRFRANTKPIEG
jgi:1-acyl-sn-glycerol-3-phosphate acyltransferase